MKINAIRLGFSMLKVGDKVAVYDALYIGEGNTRDNFKILTVKCITPKRRKVYFEDGTILTNHDYVYKVTEEVLNAIRACEEICFIEQFGYRLNIDSSLIRLLYKASPDTVHKFYENLKSLEDWLTREVLKEEEQNV